MKNKYIKSSETFTNHFLSQYNIFSYYDKNNNINDPHFRDCIKKGYNFYYILDNYSVDINDFYFRLINNNHYGFSINKYTKSNEEK